MSDEAGTLVVGLHISQTHPDAATLLQSAREDGYDYVTTMLPTSTDSRNDVTALESRWWRSSVVGVASTDPSSSSGTSSSTLSHQMEWSQHMSIPAVILPMIPKDPNQAAEYARLISSVALQSSASNAQVWIVTALTEESLQQFDTLTRMCDSATNIGMMIQLENIHSSNLTATVAHLMVLLHKAIGSQLKAVCFPTNIFLTNKRGYPALSKTHQVLFTELLRRVGRTVRICVEGPSSHPLTGNAGGSTGCLPYLQYIRHMRQRPEVTQVLDSQEAAMEEAYLDHLQRPLQPLGDHLEFATYETFEKDPVKYEMYRSAVEMALTDRALVGIHHAQVVIVVAGAGRGPLVASCLEAIGNLHNSIPASVTFRIFAVEKNPSAVVFLQSRAQQDPKWQNRVTVVHSDMRTLTLEKLFGMNGGGNAGGVGAGAAAAGVRPFGQPLGGSVDILVSELLGSFGDNELSPECLDAMYENKVATASTICIPSSYSSYLAPVSSLRLHSEARSQAYFPAFSQDGLDSAPLGTVRALETPYVVRSHSACQTHAERHVWDFSHPPSPPGTRERVAHVVFEPDPTHGCGRGAGYGGIDRAVASVAGATTRTSPGPITIHGFLGTFSAVLYQSRRDDGLVAISTCPATFSVGMFSWFPLYFPVREPVVVPPNASVIVSVWRKCAEDRVWYEWCVQVVNKDGETLSVSTIHNPNGRSYHMKL